MKCLNCQSENLQLSENMDCTFDTSINKNGVLSKRKKTLAASVGTSSFVSCSDCGSTFDFDGKELKNGQFKVIRIFDFDD